MADLRTENIKLLTLNIHKGWSLSQRRETLRLIREKVSSTGVTIACLQEVVGADRKKNDLSQFEILADGIWPHSSYGKNAIYQNGHHGNAILSQFPFSHFQNLDLSNHRFEKRGLLYGALNLAASKNSVLHLMTVHLDLTEWGRKRQVKKICEWIGKNVRPSEALILCGDFNDWRERASQTFKRELGLDEACLIKNGQHARTYPTYLPLFKLDRIYFRNLVLKDVIRLDEPSWHGLSDHLGLQAEFEL